MESDELLRGEAWDGRTTDPAGAEAVGGVLVDAPFVADLTPEPINAPTTVSTLPSVMSVSPGIRAA
jgi:hypothetical protein